MKVVLYEMENTVEEMKKNLFQRFSSNKDNIFSTCYTCNK